MVGCFGSEVGIGFGWGFARGPGIVILPISPGSYQFAEAREPHQTNLIVVGTDPQLRRCCQTLRSTLAKWPSVGIVSATNLAWGV